MDAPQHSQGKRSFSRAQFNFGKAFGFGLSAPAFISAHFRRFRLTTRFGLATSRLSLCDLRLWPCLFEQVRQCGRPCRDRLPGSQAAHMVDDEVPFVGFMAKAGWPATRFLHLIRFGPQSTQP